MILLNINFLTYILSFVFAITITIFFYFKYSYNYWAKRGIPFISPEFLYGNLKKTLKVKSPLGEEVRKIYKIGKERGYKFIGIYLINLPVFVPIDVELIKNVISKDFDHFVDRGTYCNEEGDPLSAHLFAIEGMRWKHLRQKLTPTFTSGKLKKMFQTLVDCTEELKNCLDEYILEAEPINIKKVLAQYTINVIGSCAFGLDCNSFENPESDFIKYGEKIFNPSLTSRLIFFISLIFPRLPKILKLRIIDTDVDHFFRNLVKDTIEYRENNNVVRNDFMQLLIQLKNKEILDDDESSDKSIDTALTLNEIAAQAFLFFLAGYETSSTTMTFCLYELAENPDIQEKARKEIVSVLKNHEGKFTYESMMEMHYMERVIQETLRKHPPVMFLNRKVTQEYHIPETKIVLEKDLKVFISVYGLHTDPEYYPDPEKFDPDRFTEEVKRTRPDFTYLPFGDGPRNCIGLRFGMMQTKVGLCRLLLNYKFSPNPKTIKPIIHDPEIVIKAVKGGVWLNAEKITS